MHTHFHSSFSGLYALALVSAVSVLFPFSAVRADDGRDVARDSNNTVVVNSFNKCVRTKWSSPNDPCQPPAPPPKPVAQQVTRVVIAQEERTVYFGFNQTALTQDSQTKLNSLADKLKSDSQVRQARIVGYADRIGNPSYNEKLSKKRAENVRSYLVSRGYINTQVAETRWLGESAPATNCPDSLSRPALIECLQKDRRVEVEIDYLPGGQPAKQ